MTIQRKKKKCKECNTLQYLFSKGRCKSCAQKSYFKKSQANQKKKRSKQSKKKTLTDRHIKAKKEEREAMRAVWDKNKDELEQCYCEECLLMNKSRAQSSLGSEFNAYNLAHIISKGANTKLRNHQDNFLLLCAEHHHQFDSESRREMLVFEKSEKIRVKLKTQDSKFFNYKYGKS